MGRQRNEKGEGSSGRTDGDGRRDVQGAKARELVSLKEVLLPLAQRVGGEKLLRH